jgi:hypothetical protein
MASGESAVVLLSQAELATLVGGYSDHDQPSLWGDYIKPTLQMGEVRRELREPSPPIVATFATLNATLQSLNSDELKDWQRQQTTSAVTTNVRNHQRPQ